MFLRTWAGTSRPLAATAHGLPVYQAGVIA
jgi:hypothetical protein